MVSGHNAVSCILGGRRSGFRPALIALVPADTQMAVNNTVLRDGRTYTVKRVAQRRYADEIVSQFVLLT